MDTKIKEITVDNFFKDGLLEKLGQLYKEAKLIAKSEEDILRVEYIYNLRKSEIELDTSRVIVGLDENKKTKISFKINKYK